MFADDSTFSMSHKSTDQLKEAIKEKYEKIKNYMSKNKMILNDERTNLLVITSNSRFNVLWFNFPIFVQATNAQAQCPGLISRFNGPDISGIL